MALDEHLVMLEQDDDLSIGIQSDAVYAKSRSESLNRTIDPAPRLPRLLTRAPR